MPAMAQRTAKEVEVMYKDCFGVGPEYATIECINCAATIRIENSKGISDDALKAEFCRMGWTVLPTRCPEHVCAGSKVSSLS